MYLAWGFIYILRLPVSLEYHRRGGSGTFGRVGTPRSNRGSFYSQNRTCVRGTALPAREGCFAPGVSALFVGVFKRYSVTDWCLYKKKHAFVLTTTSSVFVSHVPARSFRSSTRVRGVNEVPTHARHDTRTTINNCFFAHFYSYPEPILRLRLEAQIVLLAIRRSCRKGDRFQSRQ